MTTPKNYGRSAMSILERQKNLLEILANVVRCGYSDNMETNTNHGINYYEQKGVIVYWKPDYTYATVEGWFSLSGQTVVRRKLRGRNSYAVCSLESVYSFEKNEGS